MLKPCYLSTPIVQQFVQWLGANLDTPVLSHCHINRRKGCQWSCTSLYDAYRQYHWPHPDLPALPRSAGASFAHNAATLGLLGAGLHGALTPTTDDALARDGCIQVMKWGGVSAGNVRWLHDNVSGLAKTLIDVGNALNGADTDHPLLAPGTGLRFNAGMTKVYSLLCDDLIIYDSRVAAALGWAVTLFCTLNGLTVLPKELAFPWAPAKSQPGHPNPKRRNPSTSTLVFPRLAAGSTHAQANLLASWVLEAVLKSNAASSSKFVTAVPASERLRALEAALFMIGYDLTPCTAQAEAALPAVNEVEDAQGWTECSTLSKGNPFHYRITTNGIEIKSGKVFSIGLINKTLNTLCGTFGVQPFPLANSADGVRAKTAEMGLGTAYFQAGGSNPPDSSKLAAVLEDVQLLSRAYPPGRAKLYWTMSPELLPCAGEDGSLDLDSWMTNFVIQQAEI